jgi:hypothetical protein
MCEYAYMFLSCACLTVALKLFERVTIAIRVLPFKLGPIADLVMQAARFVKNTFLKKISCPVLLFFDYARMCEYAAVFLPALLFASAWALWLVWPEFNYYIEALYRAVGL